MWINVGKKFWMRISCVTARNVVVKFCPFDKEKNRKNKRKHVHDVQGWQSYRYDWKYIKFYYTQVYIYLEKIINMKKNI